MSKETDNSKNVQNHSAKKNAKVMKQFGGSSFCQWFNFWDCVKKQEPRKASYCHSKSGAVNDMALEVQFTSAAMLSCVVGTPQTAINSAHFLTKKLHVPSQQNDLHMKHRELSQISSQHSALTS